MVAVVVMATAAAAAATAGGTRSYFRLPLALRRQATCTAVQMTSHDSVCNAYGSRELSMACCGGDRPQSRADDLCKNPDS